MGPARLAGGHWRERPRADKTNLSIATGGTGGVYYPLGGGMAAVLSKYVPGMQATAEVTSCSVDNLKLIGSGNGYIALPWPTPSLDALEDRKIDAFFWVGGLPTAAVTELAATPGLKIKRVDHADAVPR